MTNGLFDRETPKVREETPVAAFEELVGEGKRYADQDAVAKALAEKDRFIAQLQAEAAELRTEITSQTTLDEIKEMLGTRTPQPEPQPQVDRDENQPKPMTLKEIEELMERKMTALQNNSVRKSNTDTVAQELEKAFGENYLTKVEERGKLLGLGREFLADLAASQPAAFLKLMDIGGKSTPKEEFVSPPGTDVRSTTSNPLNTGVRNKAYWDNMKKSNKALYFSKEMQIQRHQDALRLGDAYLG